MNKIVDFNLYLITKNEVTGFNLFLNVCTA